MELDALDGICLVTYTHDRAIMKFTCDIENIREGLAFNDEGMVACNLRICRNAAIESRAMVVDGGGFAMDNLTRANYLSAEYW